MEIPQTEQPVIVSDLDRKRPLKSFSTSIIIALVVIALGVSAFFIAGKATPEEIFAEAFFNLINSESLEYSSDLKVNMEYIDEDIYTEPFTGVADINLSASGFYDSLGVDGEIFSSDIDLSVGTRDMSYYGNSSVKTNLSLQGNMSDVYTKIHDFTINLGFPVVTHEQEVQDQEYLKGGAAFLDNLISQYENKWIHMKVPETEYLDTLETCSLSEEEYEALYEDFDQSLFENKFFTIQNYVNDDADNYKYNISFDIPAFLEELNLVLNKIEDEGDLNREDIENINCVLNEFDLLYKDLEAMSKDDSLTTLDAEVWIDKKDVQITKIIFNLPEIRDSLVKINIDLEISLSKFNERFELPAITDYLESEKIWEEIMTNYGEYFGYEEEVYIDEFGTIYEDEGPTPDDFNF